MPVLFASTHSHKRRRIPHEYPVSAGRWICRMHPYRSPSQALWGRRGWGLPGRYTLLCDIYSSALIKSQIKTPCFAVQTIFTYNFTHDDLHLFINGCFFKNSASFRKQYIYLSIVIETNQARGFIRKEKSCFIWPFLMAKRVIQNSIAFPNLLLQPYNWHLTSLTQSNGLLYLPKMRDE